MPAKSVIAMAVMIAISVVSNVYLYQRSTFLENTISHLQETNQKLSNSLPKASNQTSKTTNSTSIVTGGAPPAPSSSLEPLGNKSSPSAMSQSITAVAVKAVPVTDGFFQSVEYQGTVMDITVDIRDGGKGLVLVNTEVPTGVDFQTSARTAVKVAESLTDANLDTKDVIFSIKSKGNSTSSDLQAVDGPSAGAAMTVLLASELGATDKGGLKQDIVMTGTINPDGTIGKVGGVPEKAQAAGEYGAKIFLVPAGQAFYNEQTCEKRQEGPIIYQTCKSEQKPLSDYAEKNYGMKVIEVKDVKEALEYFR